MIEKDRVKENFSRGAESYDKYAKVQVEMANELIKKVVKSGEFASILEIGCGTGIFSKLLVENYKNSSFKFIDISETMLNSTKDKLGNRENFEFLCCDGENYYSGKYDLICSNAVFQWYEDIASAIARYYTMLNSGGILAFATFGEKNHFEFADAAEQSGAVGYRLNYKNKKEIISKLKSGIKIEFDEKIVEEQFENIREYLRYIKKIGAKISEKNNREITVTILKKIEKNYINKYSRNGKIVVTNHIYFFIIKKEIGENVE